MNPRRLRAATVLLLLAVASGARAEEAPPAADVERAIGAGADWLRKDAGDDLEEDGDRAPVELVVLTLAHAGANNSDPVFAKGVARLEQVVPRFTYRTALLAMALGEVNPKLYQTRLAHAAQWLVDTQLPGGEWGYPGAVAGPGRMAEGITVEPPPGLEDGKPRERIVIARRSSPTSDTRMRGDSSNTQFAILGLRACREAGIEVPKETWRKAVDYLRRFQHDHGGWGYVVQGEQDEGAYASLTCAGIASLAICLHALGTKDPKSDAGIKKALGWLDKNLDVGRNVGIETSSVVGPSPWQYYHLYSLERAGRVLGLETIGKRPWYAEGAKWLLAAQRSDGSWQDGGDDGGGTRPDYLTRADTCFALLFLTRATRPITGR